MATLEEQRRRAEAELGPSYRAKKLSLTGELEDSLASLATEEGDIAPIYDNLRKELEKLYGKRRQEADIDITRRGLFNSSLGPQTQTTLTQEEGSQVGELEGERARKLSAVAERRRIARTQATRQTSALDQDFNDQVAARIAQFIDADRTTAARASSSGLARALSGFGATTRPAALAATAQPATNYQQLISIARSQGASPREIAEDLIALGQDPTLYGLPSAEKMRADQARIAAAQRTEEELKRQAFSAKGLGESLPLALGKLFGR
jgi:hypothetical protein